MEEVRPYIIAGGKSSRMGSDKRFLEFHGSTLLERTISVVRETMNLSPVLVGDNLPELKAKDLRFINDAKKDCGPLGGIVSALEDCDKEWVLTVAVDMPFLDSSSLRELLDANRKNLDVITLSATDEPEPLVALYRTSTKQLWRDQLESGNLKMREGIFQLRWKVIEPDSGERVLININTLDDFEKARRKLQNW